MIQTRSLSHKRWLWPTALFVITALALALRYYYVITAVVYKPETGDSAQYFAYAWNLAHNNTFAQVPPGISPITSDNYRDPGYPFFLAIWMKLLGVGDLWYAAVLLCQALLGALTVSLTVQFGSHWLPRPWIIGAGLLMAIWPHSISITSFLMTETLFGFLCALALLLFAEACKNVNSWQAFAAGIIFGAAALTNAILLPFAVLFACFSAWKKFAPRKVWVALLVGAVILPGCWATRNILVVPPSIDSSSTGRALQNFVIGSWPNFHSAWRDSHLGDAATRTAASATVQAVDVEYNALAHHPQQGFILVMDRLGKQPLQSIGWYFFKKPWLLWAWDIQIGQGDIYIKPTMNSPFQKSPAWIVSESICYAINNLLFLMSIVSLFFMGSEIYRRPGQPAPSAQAAHLAVAYLLLFVTFVYSLLQAEPRYSIPFRPLEILLATTGIAGIVASLKRRAIVEQAAKKKRSLLSSTKNETCGQPYAFEYL